MFLSHLSKRSIVYLFVMVFLYSCATMTAGVQDQSTAPNIRQAATYSGPKARISVARIKCKAAKCSGTIGDGLRDMLISGLFKTNRFIVLGGKEELEEIKEEIDLAQTGYVKEEQAPQAGGWESADIIILGSITAFEPEAGGLGVGGGGLLPGMLGGIKFGKKDAYISMDLRLVDVRTRRIINTTTVDGKASSFNIGGLGVGWGGAGILGAGLSVYKNTPMEKAIRVMIEKAVNYIASQTPAEYYRYSPKGTTEVSTGTGSAPVRLEGKLKRPEITFKPGNILLFSEDFSTCKEVPSGFKILKGKVECVEFGGRRWMVNVTPESRVSKALDLKGDFAIEFDVYTPGMQWEELYLRLGRTGKGETLVLRNMLARPGFDIRFPEWGDAVGSTTAKTVHRIAIQQRKGSLRVFVDGKRIVTTEVDPVLALKNRDGFVIIQKGDMEKGEYFLVSNFKVTRY